MIKIKTGFIFAIVFLAFLSDAFPLLASDEMEKHRLDLMSSEIISNFQKKEFHQISDKFYFPEHYSDKVILKEKRTISLLTEFLFNEFGTITEFEEIQTNPNKIGIDLCSDSKKYLHDGKTLFSIKRYKVLFSNFKKGFFFIEYCRPGNNWKVDCLKLQLPLNIVNSKTINGVIKKMREDIIPEIKTTNS